MSGGGPPIGRRCSLVTHPWRVVYRTRFGALAGRISSLVAAAELLDRVADKTIIITGAGSGIGWASAVRIAREGGRVIATDVIADRLDALRTDLDGFPVESIAGDLADPATIAAVLDATGGAVDGLANVAGIGDAFLPPSEVDNETWERVLGVNVTAPMRLTRAVLPLMIEAGGGQIVNVGSIASLRGAIAGAAYTASKHAILGFTKSVAFFHGPQGIRANLLAPGSVATGMTGTSGSEYATARLADAWDFDKLDVAQPEALASSVAWLLSEDSVNVNGAIISSDGGWSAI